MIARLAGAPANQSVARALDILEIIAASGGTMGVRDIARRLGIAPAIAQRLITTLAAAGFVEQRAERKYGIGVRAFSVGNAYLTESGLTSEAHTVLQALAREHHVNTYLGVLRGRGVVYLLACQSGGPIAIKVAVGAETALHSTALGKALLAQMSDDEAKRLLGPQPYARVTACTKTRFAALQPDLKRARDAGYAVSDDENLTGVFAAGAVVRDASGAVVAAISGALSRHDVTAARAQALGKLIVQAAERISRRLGAPDSLKVAA